MKRSKNSNENQDEELTNHECKIMILNKQTNKKKNTCS